MHKDANRQIHTTFQDSTNLLEKSIMYMLLLELQEDTPPQQRHYKLSIGKLEQLLGRNLTIQELIEASQSLMARKHIIKSGKEVLGTSYVSSVINIPEENMLEVGVTSMVHAHLLQLRERYIDSLQL